MKKFVGMEWFGALLLPLSLAACSVDVSAGEDQTSSATGDGPTAQVQQEVFRIWTPQEWSPFMLGTGTTDGKADPPREYPTHYSWYNDGWVCEGSALHHCDTMYEYSTPRTDIKALDVGRGLNPRVWAWYGNSTVSSGTVSNLSFHTAPVTFQRPLKPGSTVRFSMAELVEAFCWADGVQYYYWRDGNKLWATRGSVTCADCYTAAKQVTVSTAHGGIDGIVGITAQYLPTSPHTAIDTFYSDGYVNTSGNAYNLAVP